MDVEGIVIPITYRPVVLLAIGLWGWGLNLFILMRCGIDPISLLQLHQVDKHVPFYKPIFFLAGILSLIVLFNLWLYWYLTIPGIAALPYVSLLILLLWPGKAFYRKERIRFIRFDFKTIIMIDKKG
jgi:hypothetical protein